MMTRTFLITATPSDASDVALVTEHVWNNDVAFVHKLAIDKRWIAVVFELIALAASLKSARSCSLRRRFY